jgi:hypothetical protein
MEGIQPVVRKCLNPEPLCLHTPENKHRLCNCTRNWNWCCTFSELSKEFAPCSTFIFSQLTCFASYDCPYHILIRCNPEQCVLRETSPAVVNGCWIYFHHWNILNCFYWDNLLIELICMSWHQQRNNVFWNDLAIEHMKVSRRYKPRKNSDIKLWPTRNETRN